MPANANLACVFEQLGMPGMAAQARAGKDLSRAVCALVWTETSNVMIKGEAVLVRSAAESDGYDLERVADEDKAAMIKPSY